MKGLNRLALLLDELLLEALLVEFGVFVPILLELLLDELLELLAELGVFILMLLELLLDERLELLVELSLELVLVEVLIELLLELVLVELLLERVLIELLGLDGMVAPLLDPLPELLLEVLPDPLDGDTGLSVIVN